MLKLSFLILIALAGSAFADPEPPSIVIDGLNAYYRDGGRLALSVWLKGSGRESDFSAEGFFQIEKTYGRMIGFETIHVVPVSASMQRVYVLIKYERGPAYISFDCYKPDTTWIIPVMAYNTKPAAVLPERMLVGGGK